MTEEKSNETVKENAEHISVKGVSKDVFDRVKQLAHETGKTMGEITNDAYRTVLGTFEATKSVSREFVDGARGVGRIETVSGFKTLSVTGSDLKEMGKKVIFRNIGTLVLDDIDDKTFNEVVERIIQVHTLKVSNEVRKSSVIVKCHYVDEIDLA